jgi:hypothetical protein
MLRYGRLVGAHKISTMEEERFEARDLTAAQEKARVLIQEAIDYYLHRTGNCQIKNPELFQVMPLTI